ncbi:hypothetical protein DK389_21535 [Methylobacterium durans]|uniref:Uncharacterized protein n=1 Tax=Methylobacterium durans TaxID=2202825 RepID=A0A2U8W908_9HYPH|nr:hypothetical protein DK389_21535 [Methylobacterium durans]
MSSRPRRDKAEAIDALILAAFREACRQGELGAAEHLLCALEALAAGAEASTGASACLDKACLTLAEEALGTAPVFPRKEGRARRTLTRDGISTALPQCGHQVSDLGG